MSVVETFIKDYKEHPEKIFEQLEMCNYECEGSVLVKNIAYIALKELVLNK